MNEAQRRASLNDLFSLAHTLEHDDELNEEERWRRDREIGRTLTHLTHRPVEQLRAWRLALGPVAEDGGPQDAESAIGVVLALVGVMVGWAVAFTLLYYEGTQPINVVNVLAVLVVLPLLMLVISSVVFLPGRWLAWLPGMRALQGALQMLSPGRLGVVFARILPQRKRDGLLALFGRARSNQHVYGDVLRWLLLKWSQILAVAFSLGALLGSLALVVFSDLAFGWSTTLEIEASEFHALTGWLSLPWQAFIEAGVPSFELVDGSRFFRLGGAAGSISADIAALGAWWPFLLLCIAAYALAPRIVLWLFSNWRLNANLEQSMLLVPGASRLLERLNTPIIETSATQSETSAPALPAAADVVRAVATSRANVALVDWNGAAGDAKVAEQRLLSSGGGVIVCYAQAGGANSMAEDRDALAKVAAAEDEPGIVVLVKAWEPPMLDCLDFLHELRVVIGDGRDVTVLALGHASTDRAGGVAEEDVNMWREKLAAQGDPWLRLEHS